MKETIKKPDKGGQPAFERMLPLHEPNEAKRDGINMKVVFSTRAFAAILAETTEKIKTETGGLFLGKYKDGIWYVVEAIDPGPKSVFEVAYFEYDRAYTQHLIRKTANLYASKLELIGLWHRHPGSFDIFSSTDDETNAKYAKLNEHGAISGLVNIDPDFRLTMYHVDKPCRYSKIKYEVGDELFPAGLLALKKPDDFKALMKKLSTYKGFDMQQTEKQRKPACLASFMKMISPYLDSYACMNAISDSDMDEQKSKDRLIELLLDDLIFFADEAGMEVTVAQHGKYAAVSQNTTEGTTRLYFAYSEKDDQGVFEYGGKNYFYKAGLFKKLFTKAVNEKQPDKNAGAAHTNGGGALNGWLKFLTGIKNGETDDE